MKKTIKNRIADSFDLPKEVIMDVPKLKIIGVNEVTIENHRGIVEYTTEIVRMSTSIGVISVKGTGLQVKEISRDSVVIIGEIVGLEYLK